MSLTITIPGAVSTTTGSTAPAVLTVGVGALVLNGVVFLLASKVVEGVRISGCMTAAIASLGVSLVNAAMHPFFGRWAP